MPKQTNILTKSKVVGTTIAAYGIGAPATGQTRYITFVCCHNLHRQHNTVYLASAANSANTSTNTLASIATKLRIDLEAAWEGKNVQVPQKPDVDTPLFSIAAGKCLNVKTSDGKASVFVQYYDQ